MPALQSRTLAHMADLTSKHLARRKLTSGAQAGIGVAVALGILIAIGIAVFFIIRGRRAKRLADLEKERAQLAGEKKEEEEEEEAKPLPKRTKSIKDRLKGPLYQEPSDMPPMKPRLRDDGTPASPQWEDVDGQLPSHKPWAESSPRPSFSSRRGTRMMMMM